MKKRELYLMLVILICMALPLLTYAQGPDDPNDAPIDGGLSLLVAAGAAYGIKKYRDSRKKNDEPDIK